MISALKSLGLCRWNSTYWAFKSKTATSGSTSHGPCHTPADQHISGWLWLATACSL